MPPGPVDCPPLLIAIRVLRGDRLDEGIAEAVLGSARLLEQAGEEDWAKRRQMWIYFGALRSIPWHWAHTDHELERLKEAASLVLALAEGAMSANLGGEGSEVESLVRKEAQRSLANWGVLRLLKGVDRNRAARFLRDAIVDHHGGDLSWGYGLLETPEGIKAVGREAGRTVCAALFEDAMRGLEVIRKRRGLDRLGPQPGRAPLLFGLGHVFRMATAQERRAYVAALLEIAKALRASAREPRPAGSVYKWDFRVGFEPAKGHLFCELTPAERHRFIEAMLELLRLSFEVAREDGAYWDALACLQGTAAALTKAHCWGALSAAQRAEVLDCFLGILRHGTPSALPLDSRQGRAAHVVAVLRQVRRPRILADIPAGRRLEWEQVLSEYAAGRASPDPEGQPLPSTQDQCVRYAKEALAKLRAKSSPSDSRK